MEQISVCWQDSGLDCGPRWRIGRCSGVGCGGVDGGGAGRPARVQLLQLPQPRLPPRRRHLQGLPGEEPTPRSGDHSSPFTFLKAACSS
jgi:hypothetical protein